ncbi:hypothetical protein TcCL_Unassigned03349, partial [Trypanosoma cruzi]
HQRQQKDKQHMRCSRPRTQQSMRLHPARVSHGAHRTATVKSEHRSFKQRLTLNRVCPWYRECQNGLRRTRGCGERSKKKSVMFDWQRAQCRACTCG